MSAQFWSMYHSSKSSIAYCSIVWRTVYNKQYTWTCKKCIGKINPDWPHLRRASVWIARILHQALSSTFPDAELWCIVTTNPLIAFGKRDRLSKFVSSIIVFSFNCTGDVIYMGRRARCLQQSIDEHISRLHQIYICIFQVGNQWKLENIRELFPGVTDRHWCIHPISTMNKIRIWAIIV